MSFDSLLTQTGLIERYATIGTDAYGQPVKDWQTHLTVPCRVSTLGVGWRQNLVGTETTPVDAKLFCGDIDVTEADRVTVDEVVYEIGLVERLKDSASGTHHKELALRMVKP